MNLTPVVSNVGLNTAGINVFAGFMKVSPNGKKIASALTRSVYFNSLEFFDFDNNTGKLSNAITIYSHTGIGSTKFPYRIEFSPDGNLLYMTELRTSISRIFQYNLTAGVANSIINSEIEIGSYVTSGEGGSLQLGPDNKIYNSNSGS